MRQTDRATPAELAALEPGPDRWRLVLGRTRVALVQPHALATLSGWLLATGLVLAAFISAGQIGGAVRGKAFAMVGALVVVIWVARSRLGFGPAVDHVAYVVRGTALTVIAVLQLLVLNDLRASPGVEGGPAPMLVPVFIAIVAVYSLAVVRVTAGRSLVSRRTLGAGTGLGAAGVLAWAAAVLVWPELSTADAPAISAVTAAAVAAAVVAGYRTDRGQDLVAGLWAAAVTAAGIGITIDVLLPMSTRWVPTNAPPVYSLNPPHRLVDPVGLWFLGTVAASVLVLSVRSRRVRRSRDSTPGLTVVGDPPATTS